MKRRNTYRIPKDFPGFVPYVYFIKHKSSGIWYIGSKYSKNAHPNYFFKNYFTSSKLINEIINAEGIVNFEYRIVKTFDNSVDALEYERRLIRKTGAVRNNMSANKDNNSNPLNAIQFKYKTRFVTNIETMAVIRVKFDSPLPKGFSEGNLNRKGKKNASAVGRNWYHDPITNEGFLLSQEEVDVNLVQGRSPVDKDAIKTTSNKNKIIINNGIENKFINEDEEMPHGFILGSKPYSRNNGVKRYAINNGTETKFIKIDEEIPDGYVKGAHFKNDGNHHRGKIAINDGNVIDYINPNDPIPLGFIRGGLKRKINGDYTQSDNISL